MSVTASGSIGGINELDIYSKVAKAASCGRVVSDLDNRHFDPTASDLDNDN
jgi:hypothetical protein